MAREKPKDDRQVDRDRMQKEIDEDKRRAWEDRERQDRGRRNA